MKLDFPVVIQVLLVCIVKYSNPFWLTSILSLRIGQFGCFGNERGLHRHCF
jgi:hypothetical protein